MSRLASRVSCDYVCIKLLILKKSPRLSFYDVFPTTYLVQKCDIFFPPPSCPQLHFSSALCWSHTIVIEHRMQHDLVWVLWFILLVSLAPIVTDRIGVDGSIVIEICCRDTTTDI